MKTAFVTGATGFIGRHVTEQLTRAGWRVLAFHRAGSNTTPLEPYAPVLAEGSLESVESIAAAMPEGCDAVFHIAANTSFWSRDRAQQHRDNVEGTRNMVAAALRRGVGRFVYTSSESAWGEPERVPLDESLPMRGGESWIGYERTKYLAEVEVRRGIEQGLQAVIVNPAHVMGRYDARSWGRSFRLVRDGRIPGVPPGGGSWAWAEEVAGAHLAAAERGGVGENYLLGGPDATYVDVFGEIARLLGKKPLRPISASLLRAYARVMAMASAVTRRAPAVTPELAHVGSQMRTVRSDKAIRELGFRFATIDVMLRDCFEWLRAEQLI
jgi:nucleoside-diphosphate-sugar epimerase